MPSSILHRTTTTYFTMHKFTKHVEYCSHLLHGATKYQLLRFDSLQRRAIRIIGDPKLELIYLVNAKTSDLSTCSTASTTRNGELVGSFLTSIWASWFYHRSSQPRYKAHIQYIIEPLVSRMTLFSRSFLSNTYKLWNKLPSEVSHLRFSKLNDLNEWLEIKRKSLVNRI